MAYVIGSDGRVSSMEVSDDEQAWHPVGSRVAVKSNSWHSPRPGGKTNAVVVTVNVVDAELEAWQIITKQHEDGNRIHFRWVQNGKNYRTQAGAGGLILESPDYITDEMRSFFVIVGSLEDW